MHDDRRYDERSTGDVSNEKEANQAADKSAANDQIFQIIYYVVFDSILEFGFGEQVSSW